MIATVQRGRAPSGATVRSRVGRLFGVGGQARRATSFAIFCFAAAFLLTDFRTNAGQGLAVGDVAAEDVLAPFSFPFIDIGATADRRVLASAAVLPVFDADPDLEKRIESRVEQAFDMARRRLAAAEGGTRGGESAVPASDRAAIGQDFGAALDVALNADALTALSQDRYSERAEALAVEFLLAGFSQPILQESSETPDTSRGVSVVAGSDGRREEQVLRDFSIVRTPAEARQAISLHVLENHGSDERPALVQASAALARGLVRPDFSYNAILTEGRRLEASANVEPVRSEIRRGSRVVRAGDVIDARQAEVLATLRETGARTGPGWRFSLWVCFVAVLTATPLSFARNTIRKFTRKQTDLEAMGVVLLFVLALGRIATSALGIVHLPGHDDIATVGLLVPVAGGAMLVRILINSESALVFAVVASLLAGAQMEQSAAYAAWYLVTSLVAASLVGQARERLNVLRAGAMSGLVGAGMVLILALVRVENPVAEAGTLDWGTASGQVVTALAAGLLSAMLTLGLVPLMEVFGFLTDYKLFELANLNHPLLRRLMLQAPGTYHHSVIVGSLSEAACEAVGANALLARVACYFHDIGKGVKPQYFVENQRDGQNRHDRLSPEQSAQVIINHVREGGVLARQHKLPQPIYDNIFMHHGTGLIPYFHNRAREQAEGGPVDESLFRYPGPKPNTREAGIIMLADKVEAACRTIKEPSEERMRAMIQAIVNQVMGDGQLEECPITVRELYQIANAFVAVLLGIYHHRIEYPATKAISSGGGKLPAVTRQGTITLEIQNPLLPPRVGLNAPDPSSDYEAVELSDPPRLPYDGDDA
jgi:cyclic-di-AMP phosphodiesterase PgpH